MALFKTRKRSSSPSYVSTLTIVVFIALCVFGVWMLSSKSVVPPQTHSDEDIATRTSIDTSATNDELSASHGMAEKIAETRKDSSSSVFGDNPGQLPDDAIKSDEKHSNMESQNQHIMASMDAQLSEESSLTQKEQASVIHEAGADSDVKITEPEKAQQTVTTASNNIKKDEEISAAAVEQEVQSIGKQQDVQGFDTKPAEEDINKEQLREDKGAVEANPKADVLQQDPEAALKGTSSEQVSEKIENQKVDVVEVTQKPKAEKKGRKSKKQWSTQAAQSQKENKRQQVESNSEEKLEDHEWYLCNVTANEDYIPCLDNEKAVKQLRTTRHYEHRERHCPKDPPTCLVQLPKGYRTPIEWPNSRDKIWYHNVPHKLLAEVKGHQNWVKVTGEFLTFPGGGTQFIHGALHYIDFLQQAQPSIGWGKHTRVILDVGCGVGSFGGFLFERDVITMSFAPKDEHEAQVQFALERGIPAISAVMGSQRLPFPSLVFDAIHCARCRVPWHVDGGMLLLELNRLLRPGGLFIWCATPVYQKLEEDVEIWKEMTTLTKSICWELVTINKDELNQVGAAIYRKPTSNECYNQRAQSEPPLCKDDDDPNAAWYVPLQACLHRVPVDKTERGAKWPEAWPRRLNKPPYWLNNSQTGIYGKPPAQDFAADTNRWKNVVEELSNIGITWTDVRNVMDMRSIYGGFAAALKDLPVWVFNVVTVDTPDTLSVIYERGLFGIYHDWCESFSTYPRSYDLLHADSLFSKLKDRCKLTAVMAEVDRIIRPGGKLIVRDEPSTLSEVRTLLNSLHWEILHDKIQEGVLCAKRGIWRPTAIAVS
ncbi:probable methyltransferase PMT27 [Vigna umbellata]|uniref:probable methyltransferase PMT27 n=1 Tax=Vigna umbellata TaxID=87088 RepID=UPI001F5E8359|nr:probable methyltransferase PMT27 [Vigna umbellata]